MLGSELMLIENPNSYASDLKSQAMSRAAEYRAQGYSPGEALEMGWQEAKGEDNNYENWNEPGEGMELIVAPKRRRKMSNPLESSSIGTYVLLAGAGYLFWCWYVSKRNGLPWNFKPWTAAQKLAGLRQIFAADQHAGNPPRIMPRVSSEEQVQLILP